MSMYFDDPAEESDHDPEMESWYRQMTMTPRPDGLKIEIVHGSEGPVEDPYGWTEYRVTLPNGRRGTYRSGILSERLTVDTDIGYVTFESPDYVDSPPMDVIFEDFVGYGLEQLSYWYELEYEKYADIREAELAAGWDPSP